MKKIIIALSLLCGLVSFSVDVDLKNVKFETPIQEVKNLLGKNNFVEYDGDVKEIDVETMKFGLFDLTNVRLYFDNDKFYTWFGEYVSPDVEEIKKIENAYLSNYRGMRKVSENTENGFVVKTYTLENRDRYISLVTVVSELVNIERNNKIIFLYKSPRKYDDDKNLEKQKIEEIKKIEIEKKMEAKQTDEDRRRAYYDEREKLRRAEEEKRRFNFEERERLVRAEEEKRRFDFEAKEKQMRLEEEERRKAYDEAEKMKKIEEERMKQEKARKELEERKLNSLFN